jgi:hypothetical protein
MAKMDAFLRSSGLRLKPNGTCAFIFETTRFVIEITTDAEESGEFLLYCSLGELQRLRNNFGGSQRRLLKMLAYWNEELQLDGGDDTGLLRIDSSKEDGPHVSFIYYGNVKGIATAEDFQVMLDEFVDDALDFSERLNAGDDEEEDNVPMQKSTRTSSAKSFKSSQSTAATVSTQSSDESAGSKHSSFHRGSPPPPPPALSNSSKELGSSIASINTSQEKSKQSVFSKVISTMKKRNDPTVTMAFIDPSNSSSAFVVDRTVVSDENPKPKIVISRKGAEKKGASFHVDTTRNQSKMVSTRSSQASVGDASFNTSCGTKSASFHDSMRASITDASGRKNKSFNGRHRPSIDIEGPPDRMGSRTSHNASLNGSVDIFNDSSRFDVNSKPKKPSSFNYSEPVLPSHHVQARKARQKQVKIQLDNSNRSAGRSHSQLDNSNRSAGRSHSQLDNSTRSTHSSSSHRRKTLSDADRPQDKAMQAYYDRHNAYPRPPPRSSKWCMENDLHSDDESDFSDLDEGLYD